MNTMSTVKNVVCCYVFLFILSVFGSREDVRATLQICKKGLDVSDEELEAFIKPAVPKTDYEKCLWACTLKAYNIIKEGKYDPDMALDVARDMLKNRPEGLKKIENFINYTRQEVEEMDDECELASEIVHCYGKYEKFVS
ncbi:uncharacterized protein LOC106665154, partial [Cimex lectularius]|uniref:Odorant binding protein n=1 Tax=Cimex lectularius TaxID=79782 RepID=A0A8I6SP16_CIMLE